MGKIIQIGHPGAVKIVNKTLAAQYKLLGDEFSEFEDILLDENIPIETGAGSQAGPSGGGPTNQSGVPQSTGEVMAREGANVG